MELCQMFDWVVIFLRPLESSSLFKFFISGNFYFSFVLTSLAYTNIPKNKRKTKIS